MTNKLHTPCGGEPILRQTDDEALRAWKHHIINCEDCKREIAKEYIASLTRPPRIRR